MQPIETTSFSAFGNLTLQFGNELFYFEKIKYLNLKPMFSKSNHSVNQKSYSSQFQHHKYIIYKLLKFKIIKIKIIIYILFKN